MAHRALHQLDAMATTDTAPHQRGRHDQRDDMERALSMTTTTLVNAAPLQAFAFDFVAYT